MMAGILNRGLEKDSLEFEVYSFAIDGGGLANWHSIMFEEILPYYDFDVLVIASFVDNLKRDFSIFHMTKDGGFFTRVPSRPHSFQNFQTTVFPYMKKLYSVTSDEHIDSTIFSLTLAKRPLWKMPSFRSTLAITIIESSKIFYWNMIRRYISGAPTLDSKAEGKITWAKLKERYGMEKLEMLSQIINACKERSVPVIIASVPSLSGIIQSKNHRMLHQAELTWISDYYGVHYFDGYALFNGFSKDKLIQEYWLRYDAHWEQRGSDFFARGISEFLQSQILPTNGNQSHLNNLGAEH